MFLLLGERTLECSWALTVSSLGEVAARRSMELKLIFTQFSSEFKHPTCVYNSYKTI